MYIGLVKRRAATFGIIGALCACSVVVKDKAMFEPSVLLLSAFETTHPKITVEEIELFEKKYSLSLPPDYKQFLLWKNGGTFSGVTVEGPLPVGKYYIGTGCFERLRGLNTGFSSSIEEWVTDEGSTGVPGNKLIIGGLGGGVFLCISCQPEDYGKVYIWDESGDFNDPDGLLLVANSFQEYIDSLTLQMK